MVENDDPTNEQTTKKEAERREIGVVVVVLVPFHVLAGAIEILFKAFVFIFVYLTRNAASEPSLRRICTSDTRNQLF